MFVQSKRFIAAHATGNGNGGKAAAGISIYGQESNYERSVGRNHLYLDPGSKSATPKPWLY